MSDKCPINVNNGIALFYVSIKIQQLKHSVLPK